MEFEELDALYRKMLAPSKSKFTAEVKRLVKDGKVNPQAVNKIGEYLDGINASTFAGLPPKTGTYEYPRYDLVLVADLLDMSNTSRQNEGYTFILNIVEAKSRYAWSVPIKTKSSLETDKEGNNAIAKAFKDVIDELDIGRSGSDVIAPAWLVVTDQGTEFKGKVSKFLETVPFLDRRFSTEHRKSTLLVERFNRTMRVLLARIMNLYGGNWSKHLQQVVKLYNSEKHSRTGESPIDALLKIVLDLQQGISHAVINLDSVPMLKFPIGSEVRLLLSHDVFVKKSMTPKWSTDVYKVVDFRHSFYIIEGNDGEQKEVTEGELMLVKMPKGGVTMANLEPAPEILPTMPKNQEEVRQIKGSRRATKAAKELQILPDSHLAPEKLKLLEGKKRGAAKRAAATLEKVR